MANEICNSASEAVEIQPKEHQLPSGKSLFSWSFFGLMVTQFTVALNDNIFRWLLVPIGKARLGTIYGSYDKGAIGALTIGALMFLIPFILFSGYGGYCADRFCKRKVMIYCKLAEILIMLLGILVIWLGNPWLFFVLLFLMGTQSAFYSPTKYACIPDVVGDKNIPTANGLISMTTIIAVLAGTLLGNFLYDWTTLPNADGKRFMAEAPGQHNLWLSAVILVGVAFIGFLTAHLVQKMPPQPLKQRVPWYFWIPMGQSVSDLSYLWKYKALLLVAIGNAYYWGLASLTQTNIDKFIVPDIVMDQGYASFFLGILALGIAVGSILTGFIMKSQTTLKPLTPASLGMSLCSIALFFTPEGTGQLGSAAANYTLTILFFLGIFAGMFDIPCLSYIQKNSDQSQRGRIVGGTNFLSFSGMTLGAIVFGTLISGLGSRGVWLAAGIATFAVSLICLKLVHFTRQTDSAVSEGEEKC